MGLLLDLFFYLFQENDLINVLDYDMDTIFARITWTQNHEPTRGLKACI